MTTELPLRLAMQNCKEGRHTPARVQWHYSYGDQMEGTQCCEVCKMARTVYSVKATTSYDEWRARDRA